MKQSFWKKYGLCLMTAFFLIVYTGYALLDTFVIPRSYQKITTETAKLSEGVTISSAEGSINKAESGANSSTEDCNGKKEYGVESVTENGIGKKESENKVRSKGRDQVGKKKSGTNVKDSSNEASPTEDTIELGVTDDSYRDENISVQIIQYRENDTTIYVADILLKDPSYLKTAMAYDTYGKNVKAETSEIAQAHGAILAVNGDFYGARNEGYVIRQGVLYRDKSAGNEDLVIYKDGSFAIIQEGTVSAQTLLEQGAWNVLSFGPALLEDGELAVSEQDEVGRAMNSNPRTAIGILGENHYVLVVSDGRTAENRGLSLYELAGFLKELGVETAYNLDGGGSSTMVFMDSLVNNPSSGLGQSERSVSDILYIGY